ncbi:polymer-forming cytoskeletal protein [Dechloromonas sp. H13]|uniref:bactofilin family protein n=1 Tax=Dechloromonas sp. H13 TaxID=2570193 RepID=UPI0012925E68|nr:polymer-forming cytoskeletal protein [Dechloromonas sp. H13]
MFGRKGESTPHARIDTLIGAGTQVEGNIRFAGGLRIDGVVKGNVEVAEGAAASMLVLSEQARVEGEVVVAHLVTNGTIVGRVAVTESLEMQARAKIVGDVEYSLIEMHQGAVVEGRLIHPVAELAELKPA